MMTFQASQHSVGELLHNGFRWWSRELRELLPSQVQSWLMGVRSRTVVDVNPTDVSIRRITGDQVRDVLRLVDIEHVSPQATVEITALNEPVSVRIAHESFLIRPTRLPRATQKDLRRIIDLDLETQSPIPREARIFDFKIIRRDKTGLDIEVYVIERQTVERCVALCEALGLIPAAIESKEGGSSQPHIRLAHKLPRRILLKRWSVPWLVVLVSALIILNIAAWYFRNLAVDDRLMTAIHKAKIEADVATQLHKEIDSAIANSNFLAAKKRTPSPIQTISKITQMLPDTTWLFSLQLNGDDVDIRGFSPKTSDLIKTIDQSSYFTDAEFRAPVMQGDGGIERFDLSFKFKKTDQ